MGFTAEDSLLGHKTEYVSQYDPSILFPIARKLNREGLPNREWRGVDVWTGYELSWLDLNGKPHVILAEFIFDANSPYIIESKSFKLYLNSFNQTPIESTYLFKQTLIRDLTHASGAEVKICFHSVSKMGTAGYELRSEVEGYSEIDHLPVSITTYHPDANLLQKTNELANERLVSHLLKSNCPVTGQPDWASLYIDYEGEGMDHSSLLKYIISFREHQDFHENCVERIFSDLMAVFSPKKLQVYARYTRRGGLDINPLRSTELVYDLASVTGRTPRQ